MDIYLTNSLSRKKEKFEPYDKTNIRMYVCGPTVYDRPHLGNARSAVVYDVLYRLLCKLYPKVTYVRNITDVDDKIIAAANENREKIEDLTKRVTGYYHEDMEALNCLQPTFEPKATENIAQMIAMIEGLLRNKHAYVSEGHVLFDVNSFAEYGRLSGRSKDEMIAGARVEVADYKRNPADFVLWKPSQPHENCSFESQWGDGRPGWHIECSAMSKRFLGEKFDIHGGGADLTFPHHENEIAQSVCSSPANKFAKYWVHNGFLLVDSEKMSKSLGNFKTVRQCLDKGTEGIIIRYLYMTAHYRKPLDFTNKALEDAKKTIDRFRLAAAKMEIAASANIKEILAILADDMNTPRLLALLYKYASNAMKGDAQSHANLLAGCELLGLDLSEQQQDLSINEEVINLAEQRMVAKAAKNWAEADRLRENIHALGYKIKDTKDSYELHKKL